MRTSALLSLIVVLTFAPPAVGQDWVEYINREDGFRVDFPGQPSLQQTSWASEYGYSLPAHVYSASRGRERYSITVVDYRGVEAQGVARANACPAGAEPCRGGQAGSVIGPGYWKQDVRGAVMYATFKLLQRDAKLHAPDVELDRPRGRQSGPAHEYRRSIADVRCNPCT